LKPAPGGLTTCIARSAVPAHLSSSADASKLSSSAFDDASHTVSRRRPLQNGCSPHRRQVLEHVHHRRRCTRRNPAKFS
jgi:hypothetical protein